MSTEFNQAALQLLLDTARSGDHAASKVHVMDLPHTKTTLVVDHTGKIEQKPWDEPQRLEKLLSIADVIAWARDWAERADGANHVNIWIGESNVIATLEDRRIHQDRAVCPLTTTDVFERFGELSEMEEGDAFSTKELRDALRTMFWKCFCDDKQRDSLIRQLQRVRTQQEHGVSQGHGTYEAGVTSVVDGKPIEWPERLSMKTRVFTDLSLRREMAVDVVFEADPARKSYFALWPTKASLLEARQETLEYADEMIRNELSEIDRIRVYRGQPN